MLILFYASYILNYVSVQDKMDNILEDDHNNIGNEDIILEEVHNNIGNENIILEEVHNNIGNGDIEDANINIENLNEELRLVKTNIDISKCKIECEKNQIFATHIGGFQSNNICGAQ